MNNTITMKFNDIAPNVRYVNLLQCPPAFHEGPRMIYDHQFIYVHKGNGMFQIDGFYYKAMPGDLFYYGPAVTHTIIADSDEPFLLSGIHFDFTRNHTDTPFPIGPFKLDCFQRKLVTEHINFADFCGFPDHINLSCDYRIRELILEMVREYESGRIFHSNYINGLFSTWLSIVGRYIVAKQKKIKIGEEIISQVIQFIHDNYAKNLSNEDIGKQFHFNAQYLNQLMAAHTGVPLRRYMIDLRIKKALDMILNSNMSISEISRKVGYYDIHYFSRLFRKKTGFSPSRIKRGI